MNYFIYFSGLYDQSFATILTDWLKATLHKNSPFDGALKSALAGLLLLIIVSNSSKVIFVVVLRKNKGFIVGENGVKYLLFGELRLILIVVNGGFKNL